jgi:hypothetical protein
MTQPAQRPAAFVWPQRKYLEPGRDHLVFPPAPDYVVPGPRTAELTTPRDCVCMWWQDKGDTVLSLRAAERVCPLHGWLSVPVGHLGTLLACAGRAYVPAPMREPIERLRASLKRQRLVPIVAVGTADLRALLVWLADAHVPFPVWMAQRWLTGLIDWKARPFTLEEERALRDDG